MLRTATRLFITATVALVLASGTQPAHAVIGPVVDDGTNGFLCTILKFRCP